MTLRLLLLTSTTLALLISPCCALVSPFGVQSQRLSVSESLQSNSAEESHVIRVAPSAVAATVTFPPVAADGSYSVLTTHNDAESSVTFFLARDVCLASIKPAQSAWSNFGGKLQIFLPPSPACNSNGDLSVCVQRDSIMSKITGRGYLMGNAHQEVLFGVPVPSRTNASVTWHSGLTAILRPGHARHIWHMWESVGMMWHLVLHPEWYDFVRHIDQVVTPMTSDSDLPYNLDLLAVLLAAISNLKVTLPRNVTLQTQTSLLRANPGMHCFERVIVPGIVDTDGTADPGRLRIHASPQDANRVRQFIFKHFRTHFIPLRRTEIQPAAAGAGGLDRIALAPVRVVFENRCPRRSRCLVNHKEVVEYLKASSIGPYLDFGGELHTDDTSRGEDHALSTHDAKYAPNHPGWLSALAGADLERIQAGSIRTTDSTPINGATFSFGKFTFADQVAISRNADVWLGVHGAAVANAALMHSHSAVLVLQPLGRSLYWHEAVSRASGHRYFFAPLFNVSSCARCDTIPDSWLSTANNPNRQPGVPTASATAGSVRASTGATENLFAANSNGVDARAPSDVNRVCTKPLHCMYMVTPVELRLLEDTLRQAVLHVYTVKRNVSFTLPPLDEERPEHLYSFTRGA